MPTKDEVQDILTGALSGPAATSTVLRAVGSVFTGSPLDA